MSAQPMPKVNLMRAAKRRLSLLAAIFALLTATGGWLLTSTSGLQLLAATAARLSAGGVSFNGVSGSLLGPIGVRTLVLDNGSDLRITAQDVSMDWRFAALLSGRLEVRSLQARDVEVLSLPAPLPQDLRPPLPLSIRKLDIGALRVIVEEGGSPYFSADNLAARLDSDGRSYRLQDLRAGTGYGMLTASGRMDGIRPFALQAQGELVGVGGLAGPEAALIAVSVAGDLQRLTVSAQGKGAGLAGSGEARLTPYGDFPLAALRLQVSGLDPRAFAPAAPHADLALQADLRGNADGRLEGEVSAKNLIPAPLDRAGLPLLGGQARATLSADLLKFDRVALALAGGASVSGNIEWHRTQAKGSGALTVSRLDPAALDTRLRAAKLAGSMKLIGDGAVQRAEVVLGDGSLQLDALLVKEGETLTLEKLRLARGQAALSGHGKLALDGRRACSFDGRLEHFDLAAFLSAPRSDLNARLTLTGELEPQIRGKVDFAMDDSRFAGQSVGGAGRVEFAGMDRGKVDVEFRAGDNRLSARGGFGAASDRLQLELAAPALEQLGRGFGGTLNARATLSGSLMRPDIGFTAEGRNLSMPDGQRLASLTASGKLEGEALALSVDIGDYRTGADSSTEIRAGPSTELRTGPSTELRTGFRSLKFAANGSLARHELAADALLHDGSKLALRANGGFGDDARRWEDIQWQGVLTEFSGTGALPFKLLADTPLALGRDRVALEAAAFSVVNGQIRVESLAWTPQHWSSRGSFTGIGLRAGIGFKPSFRAREGREFLRLGGEWDIASTSQLEGRLRVARESGDWVLPGDTPVPLGLKKLEFTARAVDGRIAGELTAQGERLGEWRGSVAMPLARSGMGWAVPDHAPLAGKIRIDAPDLGWLGSILSEDIRTSGRAVLEADIAGTYAAPRLLGQMRGDDLALALLDQGVRLEQGTLAARFDQKSLHIDNLSFVAPHQPQPRDSLLAGMNPVPGPGRLSASGTIGLNGDKGDLEIGIVRMPLSQRTDRWIIASGSGHLGIDNDRLSLVAGITADAGLINQPVSGRPELSEDVVILGRRVPASRGSRLSVDAALDLGEHFYLRASGLEARLAGKLNVRDTQGQQLRVTGTIAASDATFEAYGQRLTVERGIVNFQGPLADPGLNILALRKGLSVEAGVEVTGTAQHPSVRLVSTPTVPDFEKLSWIVLGRLPTDGGVDTALLFNAAGSILGGSGGITGQLKQSLGIDELSLRPGENKAGQTAADNPLGSQIATVGKRLSSRAFLSYEQGITAVAGVTKLTYTLTPRVNIVTQAGVESAIDIFYTFSFD
ncbi:MAG TPA: translocation/assembly module TamB domain-containing protein [Gallionella sp.]|nr:translocation/assembly module TamB domain-containing protein [Gallionella sp.]